MEDRRLTDNPSLCSTATPPPDLLSCQGVCFILYPCGKSLAMQVLSTFVPSHVSVRPKMSRSWVSIKSQSDRVLFLTLLGLRQHIFRFLELALHAGLTVQICIRFDVVQVRLKEQPLTLR